MDSSVLLHLAKSKLEKVLALSFDYGSKHNARELALAKSRCQKLGIEQVQVDLGFINSLFESSLLKSGDDVPLGNYNENDMSSTVVPFRNGILLAIASGLAESRGFDSVIFGAHSGDRPVYPDCRPEFVEAFSKASELGASIKVFAPLLSLSKAQIAEIGYSLDLDFENTWTCYIGGEKHCGRCAACLERREALGPMDPTRYEINHQGT